MELQGQKRVWFFTIVLVSLVIGCGFLSNLSIHLHSLSSLPSIWKEHNAEQERLYYWYPIRIRLPISLPFTIQDVALHGADGHETEYPVLCYVYDAKGSSDKGGTGFVSQKWLLQQYPNLKVPDRLRVHTEEAYLFLLIPPEVAYCAPYELVLQYTWLGFIQKEVTTSIRIKE
jgi:hypothetical protein